MIARAEELNWRRLTRGIDVKTLHTDTDRRYRTVLLRFAPGAKLFKHRPPEVEEVFVVSGDVWIHGQRMSAGDYCRADADSIHEESYSENGCLVLISASMDNHPVA
ncbi:MAG: cupin domain-containing protein [Acidobacteriota bacterium]